MPETNPQGGFDLSSLSSVLQNEDTLRQLRQMAESMGLGAQLEGALNQMQQNAGPPIENPNPSGQQSGGQNFSDSIPVFGNNGNNGNSGSRSGGYNSGFSQQNNNRNRNNSGNGYAPQNNGGNGGSGASAAVPPGLNSLLSNPAALAQLGRVMQAMNNRGPEYTFLSSLKPLLRPEKAPKIDQALQIMQMMQALRMVGGSNGAGLSGLMGLPGMK